MNPLLHNCWLFVGCRCSSCRIAAIVACNENFLGPTRYVHNGWEAITGVSTASFHTKAGRQLTALG